MSKEHRYSGLSLGAVALVFAGVCVGCGSSAPGPSGPADAGFGNQPVSHADGAGSGPSAAQRRSYEVSLKSDLQQLATNIATAEVDAPGKIDVNGSGSNVTITSYQDANGVSPMGTFNVELSPGNKLVGTPTVDAASGQFCVALSHTLPTGDATWHVMTNGAANVTLSGPCT